MDYWNISWEDSIISKLQPSKFMGGIYSRFIDSLYPFTPFINTFSATPCDPSTIRYLSGEYSLLLHKSLSVLPNILTETPNMSNNFAMELLDVYRLCIDCLDIIAPELGNLRASLDHRYYYICCLRHWMMYDEARSECSIVLEKFNTSMYETFGYEREDAKGSNYSDIVIDDNEAREFLENNPGKEDSAESDGFGFVQIGKWIDDEDDIQNISDDSSIEVRGDWPFKKCKAALEVVDFLDCGPEGDVGSYFADVVTQRAQDITMPSENHSRLIRLEKWLVDSALVPLRFFPERCEEEFLWECEMIEIKAADLKLKEVRVNTRLLYQQTKFNLLREERDSYAKLVTILCQLPEASVENASVIVVGIIKSLIGHFDLDPNRVFDFVLECFELQLDNSVFLDLIPMFPKSHVSQILGFKFQYYQRIEIDCPVSAGLYQLAALLMKEDFIDIDSIYNHLLPKDEEAIEHYNAFSAKRLDEANKMGKINLAATGKDQMDEEKLGEVTVDLFFALDMETMAITERFPELAYNQTLGLLIGFHAVDDWFQTHQLLERLSPINPVEHIQICNGLFRLIEKLVLPAYNLATSQTQISNAGESLLGSSNGDSVTASSSSHKYNRSFINFPKELFEMLASVGPYLYCDTSLLQRTTRVLRTYFLCAPELSSNNSDTLRYQATSYGLTRNKKAVIKSTNRLRDMSTKCNHQEKTVRRNHKEEKPVEPELPKYRDRAKERREDQNPGYEITKLTSFHAVAPLEMLISCLLIHTSYLLRKANTLEVMWSTRIWSKGWIMLCLIKFEVK